MTEEEFNELNNWFDELDCELSSAIRNAATLNCAGELIMLSAKFDMLQSVRSRIANIKKE